MKKIFTIVILSVLFFQISCSFKPLYTQKSFSPYKLNVIIKQKGKYSNNVVLMKNILEKRLNNPNSKPSNLKLIVSLNIKVNNLGVNKDLNTFGKRVTILVNYAMYDKNGLLTDGRLENSSTFNFSSNDYGNLSSLEDSYSKLVKDTSESVANLILAENFDRKLIKYNMFGLRESFKSISLYFSIRNKKRGNKGSLGSFKIGSLI